jgi:hypothetical protein
LVDSLLDVSAEDLSAYLNYWLASVRRNWSDEQETYGFEH